MAELADYIGAGDALHLEDGAVVFAPGDDARAFMIVTEGTVRVEQTNRAGRTVVLYRVAAGDSCVLTSTALMSGRVYAGYGYAEGHVTAHAMSPTRFRSLLQTDTAFQQLVFESFAARVGELTDVIDDLLEHRTDLRLARWLGHAQGQHIEMKQADLAQELGTAREVISRTLKAFEGEGWLRLERQKITVLNRAALLAHGDQDTM
ncbi:Crp/Fnr family transcriptional regulator [Tateyamaria sp. SN6-1]|uniref:Crp/Fnr family transcriptional regulator n=1 Tax=Tateyamaria sp. SN6-1 TaxID=3092148 RepID=UPI0039F4D4A0